MSRIEVPHLAADSKTATRRKDGKAIPFIG